MRVCVRVCIFLFLLSFQIHDSLFLSLSARVFSLYLSFQILNFLDLCSCICDVVFMFKYQQLVSVAMGI